MLLIPRHIKPRILTLTIRRDQSNFSVVFIFVSCEEKKLLSCCFGRTAKFLTAARIARINEKAFSVSKRVFVHNLSYQWK